MENAQAAVVTGRDFPTPYQYVKVVALAMLVFAAGYLLTVVAPGVTGRVMAGSLDRLLNIAGAIYSLRFGDALLLALILGKNLLVGIIILSAGDAMFGLPLIYILVANGVAVGIVVNLLHAAATPPVVILAALLPHGLIEFAALFTAIALGISLRRRRVPLLGRLKAGFRAVYPLFVIAALVEVYVTPKVVDAVLRLVR